MRISEADAIFIKGGTEPKPDLLWNLNCKTRALNIPMPVTIRGGDEEEGQSEGTAGGAGAARRHAGGDGDSPVPLVVRGPAWGVTKTGRSPAKGGYCGRRRGHCPEPPAGPGQAPLHFILLATSE